MEKDKNPDKDVKTVQICPECGSPRIEYASLDTRATGTITGLGAPEVYYCKDCGYEGSIKLKVPVDQLKEHQKEKLSQKKRSKTKEKKKKADALKPIFTLTVLLFLAAAVLTATVGRRSTEAATGAVNQTNYPMIQENPLYQLNQTEGTGETPEKKITGGGYGNQTSLKMVSRGTGLEEVTGYLFPMFVIFFSIGIFSYMIWTYGHKLEHFQ